MAVWLPLRHVLAQPRIAAVARRRRERQPRALLRRRSLEPGARSGQSPCLHFQRHAVADNVEEACAGQRSRLTGSALGRTNVSAGCVQLVSHSLPLCQAAAVVDEGRDVDYWQLRKGARVAQQRRARAAGKTEDRHER